MTSIPTFSFEVCKLAIMVTLVCEDINNCHYLCSHIVQEKQDLYREAISFIKPNGSRKKQASFSATSRRDTKFKSLPAFSTYLMKVK